MSWKPVYGILLLYSTLVTWLGGIYIYKQTEPEKKKRRLVLAILANFPVLFIFKYAGFITEILQQTLGFIHIRIPLPEMNLLLPIGISFYTFQAIAYLVDVFRNKLKPEKNVWTFALFISFFPQLVAGPIERAEHLLPQFHRIHFFDGDRFVEGLKMMVWGYFMKLCIADRVSSYVDAVFNHYLMHNGTSLFLGTFFFTFQIFCDFAGYSLIAWGVAKCLHFELTENFRRPYLSANIRDFWKRWHISLSSWFMDYVYIPLGGNRGARIRHLYNLLITFVISGLWHGANWTFLLWGAVHGLLMIFYVLKKTFLPGIRFYAPLQKIVSTGFTFVLVMLAWIFFRSPDVGGAFIILKKIFTEPGMLFKGEGIPELMLALTCIGLLMFKEIKDEAGLNLHFLHHKNVVISTVSLALMICFILLTAEFSGKAFIYFQF
jgi:D-alanyl-lipoteichoic acid acyltransferase DltB (MBOAT superfamily)